MKATSLRHPFEQRLIDVKRRVKPEPFDWYRFDTFANLTPFGLQPLLDLIGDDPMADIGTGDGDLAFLFESLGAQVTAMDWPGTNANRMQGVNLIREQLNSSIEVREVDLDSQFRLDGERFGLVLSLGLLYHLKNPFFYLETLAKHARCCFLSTRILPKKKRDAIAYLVAPREYENDPTNYWFFSEAGLLRLIDRCGWDVVRQSPSGDRLFCILESRIAKTKPVIRLLDGWHEIENNAWRWTRREFRALIDNAQGSTRFELRFRAMRDLSIEAEIDGHSLPPQHFDAGDHTYSAAIPPAGRRTHIRVRLSDAIHSDGRELGVIVALPSDTALNDESGLVLSRTPAR